MANDYKVTLSATLNVARTISDINSQLKQVSKGLADLDLSKTKEINARTKEIKNAAKLSRWLTTAEIADRRNLAEIQRQTAFEDINNRKQVAIANKQINAENLQAIRNAEAVRRENFNKEYHSRQEILKVAKLQRAEELERTKVANIAATAAAKQAAAGVKSDTLSTSILGAQTRIDNLRTKYSAFVTDPKLKRAWSDLFDQSKIVKTKEELTNLNAKVGLFEQQLEKAGKRQRSWTAELRNNISKMGQWMVLGGVISSIMRAIGQIYENVKSVNTAMTELKKVTNETSTAYNRFLDESAEKAVKLSAGVAELVEATANFSRLGFSIKDAKQLAEVAIMYKNVGDEVESVDQSTKSIISTLKAWNLDTSEAMRIVDIFNIVGNKFAVTSGQVGDAMQRAGAALAVANNSVEQSVALWTAMNEILQDGDVAATSLRFIAARLRNAAGALQEMDVDADGAADTITKLRAQLLDLTKVDIMSSNDEFRSTYDIIRDLAKVWGSLTGKQQADVTRLVAGTRQQAAFAALMKNFGTAEEVVTTALNSAGSAAEEYTKWQESITAKLQKLSAAWQEFSITFLNPDAVINTTNALTGLVNVLTSIVKTLGTFPTMAGVLGGILGAKNKGNSNEYALYLRERVDAQTIKLRERPNIISPKRNWKRYTSWDRKIEKTRWLTYAATKAA